MKKENNPLYKVIIFGAIAAVLYVTGLITKMWKGLPDGAINISLANILRMLVLIFATLCIERLVVFLLSLNRSDNRRTNTIVSIVSNLLKYIAAIVIFCGILSMVGVNIGTILASLGVLALIIGFGAESLISDVVTGMFILLDNQYNVGDIIEVNGFRGTVTDIGIRTTSITDTGGNVKIVNNSDMKNILNRSDNVSKAAATFPVPYETDIVSLEKQIPGMLAEMYENRKDLFKSVPVYLGVQKLGNSSVDLQFVAEVGEADIYSGARALNHDLFVGFRKLGVECPFPQMDIHSK